jgi:RNA polymerase sigma-70 factor (sigma-E family)
MPAGVLAQPSNLDAAARQPFGASCESVGRIDRMEDTVAQRDADFDAFSRANMTSLFRFALLLTDNRSDAEDLLQSCLARTLTHWSRVSRAGSPEQYVRRVMINTHNSTLRRAFRRKEVTVAMPPDLPFADNTIGIEHRAVLLAALATLTRAQRAAVVLRYVEDRSEAECAEILGVTVGTIKSQTHKAMARLRNHPAFDTDRSSS